MMLKKSNICIKTYCIFQIFYMYIKYLKFDSWIKQIKLHNMLKVEKA